jgi:hypothetical protein
VLDVFSDMFIFIFDQLNARFAHELEAINKQHPFEPLQVRATGADSKRRPTHNHTETDRRVMFAWAGSTCGQVCGCRSRRA